MFKIAALSAVAAIVTGLVLPTDPFHVYLLATSGWWFLTGILFRSAQMEKRMVEQSIEALNQLEKFCQHIEAEERKARARTVEGETK